MMGVGSAPIIRPVLSAQAGHVSTIHARDFGIAVVELGAAESYLAPQLIIVWGSPKPCALVSQLPSASPFAWFTLKQKQRLSWLHRPSPQQ